MHSKHIYLAAVAISLAMIAGFWGYCLILSTSCDGGTFFRTADQQGQRLYRQGRYEQAAQRFADSMWRAAALFRQGEFKQAAALYSGAQTAQGAFNHGNALVMLGEYEAAVQRYDQALVLHPDWEEARVNRRIALARAERVKKEGGNMTGGKMGADDFTVSKTKGDGSPDQPPQLEPAAGDAAARAVWLRRVQTRPADFLRAKFAYQQATLNSSYSTEDQLKSE